MNKIEEKLVEEFLNDLVKFMDDWTFKTKFEGATAMLPVYCNAAAIKYFKSKEFPLMNYILSFGINTTFDASVDHDYKETL
ncbi:MAG TPA: hypothetical protein VFX18_01990 [Candidatus Nitrosocosmicus sp.]|nr:hypothetical protein [Candidatus Nitrosocosmicus sp.]